MQALVFTVDAARRVGGPEQQGGDSSERLGERTDEGDGAADAHAHRIDAEARPQRARRGVERPAGRIGVPRGDGFERGDGELEPVRDASLEVGGERVVQSRRVLAAARPAR